MVWVRTSKYSEESGCYQLAAAKVLDQWKFTLFKDGELIETFDTAKEAKDAKKRLSGE